MARKSVRSGICLPLMLITIILTCVGLVMVLSSTYSSQLIASKAENPGLSTIIGGVKTQGLVAIVGFICMYFISKLNYHIFTRQSLMKGLYAVTILGLGLVFVFGSINDSHRWIDLKVLTIQPSEIGKFVGILYTSAFTYKHKWWYKSLNDCVRLFAPLGLIGVLILAEPDLSTTLCYCATIFIILFISGMPKKWLIIMAMGIIALIPIMILLTKYQAKRFDAWLHAWDDPKGTGYQVVQSLYAIGDGGLFGVGLGNSKQKITHLPMSETDYIFSIICEEFGFVGAVLVIGLYIAFACFGFKIAFEAKDILGRNIATGITSLITMQAFINMAVATNVLPSTGLTLPFVSKGASSLGIMLVMVGFLLSVSAYKAKDNIPLAYGEEAPMRSAGVRKSSKTSSHGSANRQKNAKDRGVRSYSNKASYSVRPKSTGHNNPRDHRR